MVGVNHELIKAVTTTPNKVAQYSGGSGGGSSLKFAVNVPNFVMLSFASGSSDLILKKFLIASNVEVGFETFII
jgi:hypothetical protein